MRLTPCALAAAMLHGAVFGSGPAAADQGHECGAFTLFMKLESSHFTDQGEPGISAGDVRMGRYELFTEDEESAGTMYFSSMVMPHTKGAPQLLGSALFNLDEGSITDSLVYELPDPANTNETPTGEVVAVITGGSGEYRNVAGTVTTSEAEGDLRKVFFDISCD